MSKSKFTERTIERLENAIRLGSNYEMACKFAGITYQTFRNWTLRGEQEDEDGAYHQFVDRIQRAEGEALIGWLLSIEEAAREGTWQAAAWKAERRYPEQFGKRVEIGLRLSSDTMRLLERLDISLEDAAAEFEAIIQEMAWQDVDTDS